MKEYRWLNDETAISRREMWFRDMERVFRGEDSEHKPFRLLGYPGVGKSDPYTEPEKWVEEALDDLDAHEELLEDPEVFRPLVLEFGPYGVHFIDKILGADVFFEADQWYNHYLTIQPGTLRKPDLEKNETWNLAKRIARAFVNSKVKLPLFGLPTLSSSLNIVINLYGGDYLADLYDDPDAVKNDIQVINEVICELHRWYLENIPLEQLQPVLAWERTQPRGFGQLCGCSTQLISAQMYRELFAPLDEQILQTYPNGGMIHLCGSHTQHIDTWRQMKSLRAIQLNDRAAWDLEEYFHRLREDQILYLIPCEEMTAEQALKITGGKRLIIQR